MDISKLSTQLTEAPTPFPNCCLSISSTLVAHLALLLPKRPAFTLSIGCGSGLLEALILHNHPNVQITGIEVSASVNRYLAEEDFDVVSGTWDLYARAPQAAAWMFVYPREPKLVSKYIEMYGDGPESSVQMILWLGPRADWADYEPCFRNSPFSDVCIPEDVGMMEFEMLAVMRRR